MTKQSQYNTLTEWKQSEPKAYAAAKKSNLIQELCDELGWINTSIYPFGRERYTDEEIIACAKKCETLDMFIKKHYVEYRDAEYLGIIYKVILNLGQDVKTNKITKEDIFDLARKKYSYSLFQLSHKKEYDIAVKEGWEDELYQFFKEKEWEDMRDVRIMNELMRTDEYQQLFERFKESQRNNPNIW